jgi:hypothetical protein
MRPLALATWSVLSALTCACEGVPTLVFAERDAASDVAEDAGDATGVPADASDEGACPGANPPPAPFVCCGPVACQGLCNGQCDACMSKCTSPGEVCCAKTNNVVCLSAGTNCH